MSDGTLKYAAFYFLPFSGIIIAISKTPPQKKSFPNEGEAANLWFWGNLARLRPNFVLTF